MSDCTRYEMETVINFNDEEKHAEIYTCSPIMKRKLDKLCQSNPNDYQLIEEVGEGKTYRVAKKKLISFRTTRELTPEQKQKIAERLNKNRSKNV
jgi:hypothetical protein